MAVFKRTLRGLIAILSANFRRDEYGVVSYMELPSPKGRRGIFPVFVQLHGVSNPRPYFSKRDYHIHRKRLEGDKCLYTITLKDLFDYDFSRPEKYGSFYFVGLSEEICREQLSQMSGVPKASLNTYFILTNVLDKRTDSPLRGLHAQIRSGFVKQYRETILPVIPEQTLFGRRKVYAISC